MQKFTCSPAYMRDMPRIMEILAEARAFMSSYGNPQWEDGFPDENFVCGRIAAGQMVAVRCAGKIAAVFSTLYDDPDYAAIDGAWLTDGGYLAVHTVAVAQKFRGCGCARFIFANTFDMAHEQGRVSVRIDTHEKNAPMRALLASLGFTQCGGIVLSRGGGRIAYEKLL